MREKIITVALILVMVSAAFGIYFYLHTQNEGERNFSKLKEKVSTEEGLDLLELNRKNPDMIGWIRIPNIGVDYPVMKGEKYLYRDFNGDYSVSGTPFVQDDWNTESANSLIFGHNMWVQKTFFNHLHKYEKKKYWKKHKIGYFYVIRETSSGEKYVDECKFKISHIIKTSVEENSVWKKYKNTESIDEVLDYMEWCDETDIYNTNVESNYREGVVTLCTCSYHIQNDRHAGRLLVVGAIDKTKKISDGIIPKE